MGRSAVVGHRLDLTIVGAQGCLDEPLPVPGGAGSSDDGPGGQFVVQVGEDTHRGIDRIALVGGVGTRDDVEGVVQHDGFDRRRAGVHSQEEFSLGVADGDARQFCASMSGAEGRQLLLVVEERGHGLVDAGGGPAVPGDPCQLVNPDGGAVRGESRSHGDVELGTLRGDELVDLAVEDRGKGMSQTRHEVQRTTEEDDLPPDRTAAGQTCDALGGHRLHDRGGKILVLGTVVDERLQVRLGEHATSRGDGVRHRRVHRQLVESRGVGVQQGGHLVDERTGSAGARAVHALFRYRFEVGDLGVLTTELQQDVGIGVPVLHRSGLGHDLLDERDSQGIGSAQSGRSRHRCDDAACGQGLGGIGEQAGKRTGDVGSMSAIVLEEDRGVRARIAVENHSLDRRRTDVEPHPHDLCVHVSISTPWKLICTIAHRIPARKIRD